MIWHVLDVRAIWIKEFAAALAAQAPTLGWCPQISGTGVFRNYEEETVSVDPPLQIRNFPLQRGFAKFPVNLIAGEANRIKRRLLARTENVNESVLVCSSPHYAPIAETWPGRVVYYVTDFFPAYGDDREFIAALDRRMCRAADVVCPNSERIADYLMREADCNSAKIRIVPNATRTENLLSAPSSSASVEVPQELGGLPRPLAGVIGDLSRNTDWVFVEELISRAPWLSWVFVGPTDMTVTDPAHREARNRLEKSGGRIRFVGPKPYSELKDYARALDVAVLPYRKREPTYSGSSTRFYEHLAAGRPMIATRGCAELLQKDSLLRLVDSPDEAAHALDELRTPNFCDGLENLRWQTSRQETWDARATSMREALDEQTRRVVRSPTVREGSVASSFLG